MRTGPKALVGLGLPAALRPHTPDKGVPFRISINGLVYERVTDDATGQFVFDDATGQPVYAQVLA